MKLTQIRKVIEKKKNKRTLFSILLEKPADIATKASFINFCSDSCALERNSTMENNSWIIEKWVTTLE